MSTKSEDNKDKPKDAPPKDDKADKSKEDKPEAKADVKAQAKGSKKKEQSEDKPQDKEALIAKANAKLAALKPWWGFRVYECDEPGFRVNVVGNGPASKGGLQNDDIVVSCNGEDTPDKNAFVALVSHAKIGESFSFVTLRRGERKTAMVRVGCQEADEATLMRIKKIADGMVTPADYHLGVLSEDRKLMEATDEGEDQEEPAAAAAVGKIRFGVLYSLQNMMNLDAVPRAGKSKSKIVTDVKSPKASASPPTPSDQPRRRSSIILGLKKLANRNPLGSPPYVLAAHCVSKQSKDEDGITQVALLQVQDNPSEPVVVTYDPTKHTSLKISIYWSSKPAETPMQWVKPENLIGSTTQPMSRLVNLGVARQSLVRRAVYPENKKLTKALLEKSAKIVLSVVDLPQGTRSIRLKTPSLQVWLKRATAGMDVVKYSSSMGKPQWKHVCYVAPEKRIVPITDEDEMMPDLGRIQWSDQAKGAGKSIDVNSITSIVMGTPFFRFTVPPHTMVDSICYVTIVTDGRTLDLELPNSLLRQHWIGGIKGLFKQADLPLPKVMQAKRAAKSAEGGT